MVTLLRSAESETPYEARTDRAAAVQLRRYCPCSVGVATTARRVCGYSTSAQRSACWTPACSYRADLWLAAFPRLSVACRS